MADLEVAVNIVGRDGLSAPASAAAATLQRLQLVAQETTSVFGRLWSSMNQGIGIAAGFLIFDRIGAAFSAVGGAMVGFNQQIDAARASMGKFFDGAQSLNNSLTNLQDLANRTPFQFPSLVTAQQRTIAVARSADELKSNLDAITVAVASSGRVAAENFDRVSLALGQIATKGRVQGDELLQLNEAGVNAAQMLADYFKVSTGAVMEMVSEGKVSAQDMFAALRQYAADPKNRAALDGLAQTFEGAMSTIKDVLTSTTAAAFRPFFDLLTDGANAVAQFLQADQFKAWAEALRLTFEGAVAGIRSFLGALEPLGRAISTAFGQATSGDFGGAFSTLSAGFKALLDEIGASIASFTSGMFGAGAGLIGEFANGMVQGGVAAVQAAVDTVASIIASFLVGQSPPPAGPLSTIDQAGTRLMETYGEGMQQGLGPAKEAVEAVDDQIRDIGRTIAELDFSQSGLKNTIDDLKRGYEDMLRPLEDQLKVIERQRQEGERALSLQFQQRELSLREAELDALGDPNKRAEILGQIELLKQRQAELGLQDSLADVERQKAKLAKDGKRSQLEDLQYTRQRSDLERRLKDSKDKGQRESIRGQIQELDLRHRIALDQRRADQEDAKRKTEQLNLRGKQLQKEKELAGLADKTKLAQIKRDRELLGVDKERASIEQTRRQLELDRQKDTILAQVTAVKEQERERLAPLQEQARLVERQKQGLEQQRKQLQLQKGDLQDVVDGLKKAEKAAKDAAKAGASVGPGLPAGGIKFDLTAAQRDAEEKVKDWGRTLATKISEGFQQHGGQILAAGIGAVLGGLAFGPLGAIVGGFLVPAIWDSVNAKLVEAGFDASPVLTRLVEGIRTGNWSEVGGALLSGFQGVWTALFAPGSDTSPGGLATQLTAWIRSQVDRIPWSDVGASLKRGWDSAWSFIFGGRSIIDAGEGGAGGRTQGLSGQLQQTIGDSVAGIDWQAVWGRAQGIGSGFVYATIDQITASASQIDWRSVGESISYWIVTSTVRAISGLGDLAAQAIISVFTRESVLNENGPIIQFGAGLMRGIIRAVLDYPMDVVGAILTVFFTPARWLRGLEAVLRRIPIGGRLLAWITEGIAVAGETMRGEGTGPLSKFAATFWEMLGVAFRKGTTNALKAISEPLKEVFDPAIAKAMAADWLTGLLEGLRYTVPRITDWIRKFASDVLVILRDGWKMRSPSLEMRAIGIDFLQGFIDGLDMMWKTVIDKIGALPKDVIDAVTGYAQGPLNWLKQAGSDVLQGFRDGVQSFWDGTLRSWLEGAGSWIQEAVRTYSGGPLAWLSKTGGDILQGFRDGVQDFWDRNVKAWLEGAGDWITKAVRAFGEGPAAWLKQTGSDVLEGLRKGIESALEGFWNWIQTNLVEKIPQFIRDILNLDADTGAMAKVGERMVRELEIGMENRWPSLEQLMGRLAGQLGSAMGGDVDDWLKTAVAITGVGSDWLPGLRRLVDWESSGNPRADNAEGSGAAGLLQMMPGTFSGYRHPDLPDDIYNPLSNAVASIRYILDQYGSVYEIPGIRDGNRDEFPGYGDGGIAWAPQIARLAEKEPELIVPLSRVRPGYIGEPDDGPAVGSDGPGLSEVVLARAIAKELAPLIATIGRSFEKTQQELAARERDMPQRTADRLGAALRRGIKV